ncbi:hypothetical protein [Bacillus subtilis]|nr:hypothetical protein [Bacillus subtilis]EHA30156.1 hypothetical protein BSSC8_32530 [Bacillus subtilis subsp. subtilis str. SC-8]
MCERNLKGTYRLFMKALYFFGPLCLNMAKEDVGYKLSGNAAKDAAIRLW